MGKGCINYMMNAVPFMVVEDEPRIQEMVKGNNLNVKRGYIIFLIDFCIYQTEWIEAGEVPEYKQFTEELKSKRTRRHNKYSREKLEAREIKEKLEKSKGKSLEDQIMQRQNDRASNMGNFFDKLMDKYGSVDDSEEYVFEAKREKVKSKKTPKKFASAAKTKNNKPKEQKVKNGGVRKTRSSV